MDFTSLVLHIKHFWREDREGNAGQVAPSFLCNRKGWENTPCYTYSSTLEKVFTGTLNNTTVICGLLMGLLIDTKTVISDSAFIVLLGLQQIWAVKANEYCFAFPIQHIFETTGVLVLQF